jgi:mannosylglycerate hydrolase
MSTHLRRGIVVSHTHWDRAWYWTFEQTRARLVDLMDGLLALLARDPEYRHFLLDGQLALLDDYLEVRPERRDELREHLREGRLSAGPFYVLPDLFIPSGESLLRNLEAGRRAAKRLGAPSPQLAYLPDPFGLPAQLPQVLDQAGLAGVFFARGMGDEVDRLDNDFLWRSRDGSEVLATLLGGGGYCNLACLGQQQQPPRSDGTQADADRQPEVEVRAEAQLRRAVEALGAGAPHGVVLLANGCDHLPPQPELPRLLEALDKRIDGMRLRHGSLADYHRAVRQAMRSGRFEPRRFEGELRGARQAFVLSGVLSARVDLKRAHRRVEAQLLRWVEPALALSGRREDQALCEHAWKLLLLCQPHDDICGCSVDAVHDDDHARIRQSGELAEVLVERALDQLAARAPRVEATAGQQTALVVNPLPWATTALLPLPAGWSGARDADGAALLQQSGRGGESWVAVELGGLAARSIVENVENVENVEATENTKQAAPAASAPVRARQRGRRLVLENDALRLSIGQDGRFDLTDRTSGVKLERLGLFEDEGDAGDSYDFSPPVEQSVQRLALDVAPRLLEAGPLRATALLSGSLRLPASLDGQRRGRAKKLVGCPVQLRLSVSAGESWLRVAIVCDNRAVDHRLRFVVRTPFPARALAAAPFELREREAGAREHPRWTQPAQPTFPISELALLQGAKGGVAIVAPGLREGELRATRHGSELLVTLLRSVGWLSRGDLLTRPGEAGPCWPVEGVLQQGEQRAELALMPFAGRWQRANAPRFAALAESGPRLVVQGDRRRGRGVTLDEQGLLTLRDGRVDVTSLRSGPGGSLELRMVNLTSNGISVDLGRRVSRARRVDLARRPREEISDPRRLHFQPKQIVTVRLWFS